MPVRILLTGLAGGVLLFFWGFVAHEVVPLGTTDMKHLGDREDAVIATMRDQIKVPGLYAFPFWDTSLPKDQQEASRKKADEKNHSGPHGLLFVDPKGNTRTLPGYLVVEFITNVITALLAAFLLSQASGLTSFGSRVMFVALLGLIAGIAVNVPQWNWYYFPTGFTIAALVEHVVGFALVGVAAALIMKPKAAAASAPAGAPA